MSRSCSSNCTLTMLWKIWRAVVCSTHISKHTPEKTGCFVIHVASLLGPSVCSSDILSSISDISRQQTLSLAVGITTHLLPHGAPVRIYEQRLYRRNKPFVITKPFRAFIVLVRPSAIAFAASVFPCPASLR